MLHPADSTWIAHALAVRPTERTVATTTGELHVLHWPHQGAPTLLLLHAAAANAQWWRIVAPYLAQSHDVIAMDFSGHGASHWKPTYSLEIWADDVLALIQALDLQRPLIVGHSLGGRVGLVVAATAPDSISGLVMVDAAVYPPGDEIIVWKWPQGYRPPQFPDKETAMGRYTLAPFQRTVDESIRRFLASHSLRPIHGGFTWHFDPTITSLDTQEGTVQALLPQARGRTALIYGDDSPIVPASTVAYMVEQLGSAPAIGIPQAQHHVFIDQPQTFVTALQALLATWRPC